MRKFIVASRNRGKLNEIKEILHDFPFDVISMEEAGIFREIDEHGETFEQNALIKAIEVFNATNEIVMADDSGLEVDYLNGAPGIYSSRFAGENSTDEARNKKLLKLLEGVPFEQRTARFVCAVAVVFPDGNKFTVKGTCEGVIGNGPAGKHGFGYDPLFYMPEYKMTMAQMKPAQKHRISHRGKALRLMVEKLRETDFISK